ncbi:Uncharacterized protein APZ42_022159 [Daphnia magna]|uniref:Uncharacterized protein n=1 Tax=Daphnia magna TaxID=35525 RepID=A0A164W3F6_9CRUS|nr:Uncharacterized protein APZ42_022159 [Daphnia magna]
MVWKQRKRKKEKVQATVENTVVADMAVEDTEEIINRIISLITSLTMNLFSNNSSNLTINPITNHITAVANTLGIKPINHWRHVDVNFSYFIFWKSYETCYNHVISGIRSNIIHVFSFFVLTTNL